MLLRHFKRLCVILACSAVAAPQNALPTVTSTPSLLPDVLQRDVPACAQACVRASLAQQYPVSCTAQQRMGCLCSSYGLDGDSLGEIALGCVYASCGTVDRSAASAYNVCLGQKDAVFPTKTALTIVASSAPTTSTSKSPSLPITTSMASTTSTTLRTRTSSTQSVFADSISLPPPATSSASPTSTLVALPVADDDKPRMTPAQIAGLSVAAVAALIIAIGLMALSVFLRKRKERNRFSMDEKNQHQRQKQQATRNSHYIPIESRPEPPPARFPMRSPPAPPNGYPRLVTPSPNSTLTSQRRAQRLGVGTSNFSPNFSTPLDQIGLAITGSVELDGTPARPKAVQQSQTKSRDIEASFRPSSTMTQATVFEEDEPATRRSSKLLPTPPCPVPPIRSLQPSRPNNRPLPIRPTARQSELFLDIPVRHGRPRPKRIVVGAPAQKAKVASPSSSQQTGSTSTSTPEPSIIRDISGHRLSTEREIASQSTPNQSIRAKQALRNGHVQPRKPSSATSRTVSRTVSRTSTNVRDSASSHTSFETADPNDPTPDDEDDKQLSDDNRLSPVAESPISRLRYPKVPRTTNQFVPRSPTLSTQKQRNQRGSMCTQEPSSLLVKRRGEQQAHELEARLNVHPVLGDPFVSPARKPRSHVRSTSAESWTQTPQSKIDRSGRGYSGMWQDSPFVNEPRADAVQPLNIKRNTVEMATKQTFVDGLKSPTLIPHLTPTRKGDDLFISVGWGSGGR